MAEGETGVANGAPLTTVAVAVTVGFAVARRCPWEQCTCVGAQFGDKLLSK